MTIKKIRLCGMLMAGICCFSVLNGCGSKEKADAGQPSGEGAVMQESQAGEGMYKPSELTTPRQDSYKYEYMGLTFSLPESLMARMDKQETCMMNLEEANEDETALSYGLITWKSMTDKQRNMEVASGGDAFYDWLDSLAPVGAIGVYNKEQAEKIDELTGCTSHQEIGKSKDGEYTYYLSTNPDADGSLLEEINDISYEITDMVPLTEYLEAADQETDDVQAEGEQAGLGEFSTTDVNGDTYTQEMFAENDLTMVNVFTTWCTPCVNEIPDLQKLSEEMADHGVRVVGVVLDCVDGSGSTDEEAVKKAKVLAERTGASYPFLIPDAGYMNGRLAGINAVPETFFVDKNGNIVGETYSGSHTLEEWKEIVEKELKGAAQ